MKRFVRNSLLFFCIFLPISLILPDIVISNLAKRYLVDSNMIVWNEVMEGKAGADIIINGTSLSAYGINPSIVEERLGKSTYNISFTGHHFSEQYFRYLIHRQHDKKPEIIIQSVEHYTMAPPESRYDLAVFFPWMYNLQYLKEYIRTIPKFL